MTQVQELLSTFDSIKIKAFQLAIISWYCSNGRSFPWRQTHDPFHILIAEIVLKLTGAWKAERAYNYLVEKFGTPQHMANANLESLAKAFRPLGLHSRAQLLIDIAKQLDNQFSGQVPDTYSELISLKGIGQYMANAILCLAYGKRVPLVDGSVSRLFRRCFNYITNKQAYADKNLWQIALEFLPESDYREYNLGLIDVGALICKYPKPSCDLCPVTEICAIYKATLKVTNFEANHVIKS